MKRKPLIACVAIVALAGLWALFRPELLFVKTRVDESFPSVTAEKRPESEGARERVIARGEFFSVAHETRGTATIYRLGDGRQVLRLTQFETSNGPDVRVLLSADMAPKDNDAVKRDGFVELAKLKGNVGDQNYELPRDVDLDRFHSVTIWCNRFGVNFGSASLASPSL